MFIRRVRTASGATAVQIAEYVQGHQQIVEHVGSAHTQAALGVLLERARQLLADPAQGVLDLGVEPAPLALGLVSPAGAPGVFSAAAPAAPAAGGTGRVIGTDSRILFEALVTGFADLGFDALDDAVFRDVVIARIVEPTPLLDSGRVLRELGRAPASYATMKRTLARATTGEYRDRIATRCFQHARTSGDVSLVLYDVTTLYLEAEEEDELRRVGYSRERRVDRQIVMGQLVDRGGSPLEIGRFEGNTAETTTITPVVKQFQARHSLADMVVVADAGMLSAANLRELDEASLAFIVGCRATKAPIDIDPASHFRWHGDTCADEQLIDTMTHKTRRTSENHPLLSAERVWDHARHPGSWQTMWAYSRERAVRDSATLTARENLARAVVAGNQAARTLRFVKTAHRARPGRGRVAMCLAAGRAERLRYQHPHRPHGPR